jgi:hypothetical protein
MARRGQIDLFTRRVRRPPTAPEFALQCMVADTLRRFCRPDWRWTHIASGEYRPPATAARLQRMGVIPGWPDFILLSPDGWTCFLELKRRGGRLSDEQAAFAEWCKTKTYAHVVVDNYEAALGWLKTIGIVPIRIEVSA